jgi:hypothetical protein
MSTRSADQTAGHAGPAVVRTLYLRDSTRSRRDTYHERDGLGFRLSAIPGRSSWLSPRPVTPQYSGKSTQNKRSPSRLRHVRQSGGPGLKGRLDP